MAGSWIFRQPTWDVALMGKLAMAGAEVGYHYEELATLVNDRGAATATAVRR